VKNPKTSKIYIWNTNEYINMTVVGQFHNKHLFSIYNVQRSHLDPASHIYEQVVCGPWELNKYNLVLTNEKLGTGQFGMVKKGFFKKDRDHRIPVAVKSLRSKYKIY
jgi:hypothetical protein